MLLEDAVADVLRPGGPLSTERPGWEPREGQLAMAKRIARALALDERVLVEAGTGTGKTLAYLVPAILSGRKIVVATGTKTLQDQIAAVDLPLLRAALPAPFTHAVMKGLSNYVCLRRLKDHTRQQRLSLAPDPDLDALMAWLTRTETGDRSELSALPDEAPIWREVTATPETRLGSRCPHYEDCFITRMRRRAADAQLILTNHHLYFADLALRARWPEAQVLPSHEVVIFDEAHQLEEVATEFFGVHVSTQRLLALSRDIARVPSGNSRTTALARRLAILTDGLAESVRARLATSRDIPEELRIPAPDDLWSSSSDDTTPVAIYHQLDAVLEEATALLHRLAEDDPGNILVIGTAPPSPPAAVMAVLDGLSSRASALRNDLAALVDRRRRDEVHWLAVTPRNISLRSSPIDVAPFLGTAFGAHPGSLIFTSATLTTGSSFDFIRARLGLGDTADELTVPSPFRYARQALIYLAADLPTPSHPDFSSAVADRLLELCRLSRGRALLLFTSFRNLRVVESRFRAAGRYPLLVQGERPRHALLEALRTQVGSVLLATQSFWEGVDVPGEALSLVVMDKLPFAVPDDPLVAARMAAVRDLGGDPFGTYQLPHAALALKQGFGRLIRTRSDRGVVALLDNRILHKSYGNTLLHSLPRDCPRTESLDDVAAFFGKPTNAPDR